MKQLLVLCAFLIFALFSPFCAAFAQESSPDLRVNADVTQDHRTLTQSTVIELLVSASCILTGVDPVSPDAPCLGIDPVTQKLGYGTPSGGGLVGLFGGMIGGMYNIPVSTHDYVAYNVSKFGVADHAYAQKERAGGGADERSGEVVVPGTAVQGEGFGALSPVIEVWVAFRNVVFVFFVILFILIGLGIMFRLQVDQRAVMSIQNQLPKIVLVIILVVLSYGIAGFLIDLMYILMYFIFELFDSIDGVRLDPSILQSDNPLGALGGIGGAGGIVNDASGSAGDIIASIFDGGTGQIVASILTGIIGGIAGSFIAPGVGSIIGALGGIGLGALGLGDNILGMLGHVVAFVIFGAALLIALIRIWFSLLKAFVSILIAAVLAPLWIAASLIPATPFPVSSWFRFMIGNLLMFPAALAMFLFAYVFLQLFGQSEARTISFPFIGNPNNVDAFGALIAFGIILMTPAVITKVKDAVGAPAGDLTSAVTGTLAGGKNVVGGLIGGAARPFWGADRQGNRKPLTRLIERGVRRAGGERMGTFLAQGLPGRETEDKA